MGDVHDLGGNSSPADEELLARARASGQAPLVEPANGDALNDLDPIALLMEAER